MNIILLSGGSGKRLWPLSNELRSKQFLKLLINEDGQYESMVQRVYRQLKESGLDENIVIATSASQEDVIRSQLGCDVDVVLEPERRNTYPAIALASSFLKTERGCSPDDIIVVLPVDPYTGAEYFYTLKKIEEVAKKGVAEIVLMGIEPILATSKYGYILPKEKSADGYELAKKFIEKPDESMAERLIEQGAVWNGGVFSYRLGYMEKLLEKRNLKMDYKTLLTKYSTMKNISFDYEVVEAANSVAFVRYTGEWKDLGTWNTLTDEMSSPLMGKVVIGEGTKNTNVINETEVPVVVLGAENMVVAAGHDGILVTGKEESTELRNYVDKLDTIPRYEEHSWGNYEILDYTDYDGNQMSIVRRIHLEEGKKLNCQNEVLRDRLIAIIGGSGNLYCNGHWRKIQAGDFIQVRKKDEAYLEALSDMYYIEVQAGEDQK